MGDVTIVKVSMGDVIIVKVSMGGVIHSEGIYGRCDP